MTTVINKGQIGEQDIYRFDGTGTNTFTRDTSTGATLTLTKIGYEVNALSAYGGGVLFTDATVTAALTAIGTTNKATMYLAPGTWVFNENIDYSAYTNITFKIPAGALISHGAFTLNIPNVDAGLYQIFTGAGAVTLSGSTKTSYPEWWETNTHPGTTDMTDAITAALAATNNVKLSPTTYLTTSTLTAIQGKNLIGTHRTFSVIKSTADASVLKVTYLTSEGRVILKDFAIYGDGSSGQHGVEFAHGTTAQAAAYVKIDGLHIHHCGGNGIYGGHDGHVNNIDITGCVINYNELCGIDLQSSGSSSLVNSVWIHHNDNIAGNGADGVRFFGNNIIVESNAIQANDYYAISVGEDSTPTVIKECYGSVIQNNYTEQNGYAVDTDPAVIGIFPSYDAADTYNIVKLSIQNNYFGESATSHAGGTYRSIIFAKNQTGAAALADTYLTLNTKNNYAAIPIIYLDTNTKLFYGSTFDEYLNSLCLPLATLNAIAAATGYIPFYNLRYSAAPTISYANSWVAYGSSSLPVYFLDGNTVILQGALKSGTVGQIAFYLPQYMWPTQDKNFIVITKTTFDTIGVVSITASNGAVTVVSGDNSYISLDGITYDKRF